MIAQEPAVQRSTPRIRLPLSKPAITYVMLGAIALVFVIESVTGGSTSSQNLIRLGAQVNSAVANGELWRLLAAMFLHIGVSHIAFNGWALFSLGTDVEGFYGPVRFALIYFFAGLLGNVAYYLLGPDGISAGASGAVFGLIGAEVAFFLANRELFGSFGRQRLGNLGVLIAINLFFGFTVPGINNLAHLGGLVGGLLLGLGIAPRYRADWQLSAGVPEVRLVDRTPSWQKVATVAGGVALLLGALTLGNARWSGNASTLWLQAETAYKADDLEKAVELMARAAKLAPDNPDLQMQYGLLQLELDRPAEALVTLQGAYSLAPEDPDLQFGLGNAYLQAGRLAEAKTVLARFLENEPTGRRADIVRRWLAE